MRKIVFSVVFLLVVLLSACSSTEGKHMVSNNSTNSYIKQILDTLLQLVPKHLLTEMTYI